MKNNEIDKDFWGDDLESEDIEEWKYMYQI